MKLNRGICERGVVFSAGDECTYFGASKRSCQTCS